MDDEVEKLTKTEVKELAFSDRLIEALLPEPELRDNPRYRYAGAPMKLWLKSDVDRAMETDEFKEHLKVREKRSLAARKAAETRRAKTLARARERVPLIEVIQGWSEDEIGNRRSGATMSGRCRRATTGTTRIAATTSGRYPAGW